MIISHVIPEEASTLIYEAVVRITRLEGSVAHQEGLMPGGYPSYSLMAFLWVQSDGCGDSCIFQPDWQHVSSGGPVEDERVMLSVTVDVSQQPIGRWIMASAGLDLYLAAGASQGITEAAAVGYVESITVRPGSR